MRKPLFLACTFVAAVAAAAAVVAAPPSLGAIANISADRRGAALYVSTGCAYCHGYVGQGGMAGPRLAGKTSSPEAYIGQLRYPSDEMPPYTPRVISDADIVAIYRHVTSFETPGGAPSE